MKRWNIAISPAWKELKWLKELKELLRRQLRHG
jgi:hypothetical protein